MGISDDLKSNMMKNELMQQISLLKAKNAIRIIQHVEGRAAKVGFVYDKDMEGMIVLRGDKYRMFRDAGGFDGTVKVEAVQLDEPVKTEVKEVVNNGESKETSKSTEDVK